MFGMKSLSTDCLFTVNCTLRCNILLQWITIANIKLFTLNRIKTPINGKDLFFTYVSNYENGNFIFTLSHFDNWHKHRLNMNHFDFSKF